MQAAKDASEQVNTQITMALSSLNPNWLCEAVKAMFDQHAAGAMNITQLMVAQDFVGALDALDAAVEHARTTADVMSDGLVAQFPQRFS